MILFLLFNFTFFRADKSGQPLHRLHGIAAFGRADLAPTLFTWNRNILGEPSTT